MSVSLRFLFHGFSFQSSMLKNTDNELWPIVNSEAHSMKYLYHDISRLHKFYKSHFKALKTMNDNSGLKNKFAKKLQRLENWGSNI